MSDILWEWNGQDDSQFDPAVSWGYQEGQPDPTVNVVITSSADLGSAYGRNALRFSGTVDGGWALFPFTITSLPERYIVQFTLLSQSDVNGFNAFAMFSPFMNTTTYNGFIFDWDRFAYPIQDQDRLGSSFNVGTATHRASDFHAGGIRYSFIINERPGSHNPSGSYNIDTVKFEEGLAVVNTGNSMDRNSFEFLTGSWAASAGGTWKTGLAAGIDGSGLMSFDFYFMDLRVLKHPLDQGYY